MPKQRTSARRTARVIKELSEAGKTFTVAEGAELLRGESDPSYTLVRAAFNILIAQGLMRQLAPQELEEHGYEKWRSHRNRNDVFLRTDRPRPEAPRPSRCMLRSVSNLINLKPVTACDVWQKLRAATSITYEEVRNAIEWLAEDGRVEEAEGVDRWVTSQVETSAFAEHISRTTSGALVATDASWCAGIGGGAVTWAAAGGKIRSDLVLLADVVDNNVAEAKTLRAGIKRAEASSGVIMTDSSYARREVSTMDVVTTGKVDIMLLRRNAHPVHAAADLGAKRARRMAQSCATTVRKSW